MKIWNIIDLEGEFLDTKVQRYKAQSLIPLCFCTFKNFKTLKKILNLDNIK